MKSTNKNSPLSKLLTRPWRRCLSSVLSLCLLLTSFNAVATGSNTFSDITGAAIGAMGTFANTFTQSMQQTRFAQQAAMMMSGLQPQITPARFFPHCTTAVARQNFPVNACREITDPGALMLAEGLATLAENYDGFYEQLLSPAQNSPFPVGVQCLDEARKKVDAEISEKLNSLTRAQTALRKNIQLFRDINAQVLEQMRGIKGELDGSDENTQAGQGRDMASFFQDAACQEAMNQSQLAGVKGLRGARAMLTEGDPPLRTAAAQFLQDEGVIRQHLETQIERIVADIQRDGIDRWLATQGPSLERARNGGLTQFEGLKAAIGNELSVFQEEKAQIQRELQAVGVALPQFDRHFGNNVEGFKRNAGEFLRKRFINSCVDGSDNSGTALSTQQILDGLRLEGSATGGTTISSFRMALQNILNSDSFIEDKMAQISALEQRIGGGQIRVEFLNEGAQRSFATPFELYRTTIDRCAQRFETDDTFSPGSTDPNAPITADVTSRQSRREQLDRASRYLEDAKKLESGFISRISGSVRTRILECGGGSSASASRSGQCNPNAMETGNTDFCVNTANTCARNVQTCFAKADQLVKEREAQILTKANTFNENLRGLVAQQETLIRRLQGQVEQDQVFLRRFLPNATFEVPSDMFVPMPEMQNSDEFGVQLLAGGNLQFLENAASKIDDMKRSLEDQRGLVNDGIQQYMDTQKTAMESDRARWNTLKNDCLAKAQQFRQQVAQRNEAGAKAQQEQGAKVSEFCFKYDRLRHANPTGGCNGSNSPSTLMGDANRIAAHLDPTVVANLDEYQRLCAQTGNNNDSNGESGDSSSSSKAEPLLQRVCDNGGVPEGLTAVTDEISRNFPTSLRAHRGAILRYMRGGSDTGINDIPGFESGAMRTAADQMREIARSSGGGTGGGPPTSGNPALALSADEGLGVRAPTSAPTPTPTAAPADMTAATSQAGIITDNRNLIGTEIGSTPPISFPSAGCSSLTPARTPATESLNDYIGRVLANDTRGGILSVDATHLASTADITTASTAMTALRTCLDGAKPAAGFAGDATNASRARYDNVLTRLNNITTSLTALNTAAHPTAPPTAVAGTAAPSGPVRGGVCGEVDRTVNERACSGTAPVVATGTVAPTCNGECSPTNLANNGETMTVCRARLKREEFRNPSSSEAASLRSRLSSIREAFRSGSEDDTRVVETWSAIGERGAGSCAALANGARAGSAFGSFLQAFDQQTIGAGAAGR